MAITAAEVNKLRKQTGAGLMDCKKALTEANGDFEAAIDILRKKGQKVSALRAGRQANEGVVFAKTSDDKKIGVLVKVNCETDFVAKNADFISFTKSIADLALTEKPENLDQLLDLSLNGLSVREKVIEQVGVINEKIELSGYVLTEGECIIPYIHAGYKIGVLVNMSNSSSQDIGRDIAMQVAAMSPLALDKDEVPEEVIQRELEIGREQALAEGKPDNIVDQIAKGKLNKFYKEKTLLNQQYVKDGSKTVGQVLKEVSGDLKINSFKRMALVN